MRNLKVRQDGNKRLYLCQPVARGHQEVGEVDEGLPNQALLAVCTLDRQPQGGPSRERDGGLKEKAQVLGLMEMERRVPGHLVITDSVYLSFYSLFGLSSPAPL